MPVGRHKQIAKKARKAHAKRLTKHQRPLTARQKGKVESCMDVAAIEAARYARIRGLASRLDELRSHAESVLLHVARNHVAGKASIRTLATQAIRRDWKEWSRRENKRCLQFDPVRWANGQNRPGDELKSNDFGERLDGSPPPEDRAEANELAAHMAKAMEDLNGFDRNLLNRLVCKGETLKEVGDSLGYTLNRIHQFRNDALEKLRRIFQARLYGPAPEPPDLFNNVA